jgi:hypothetical protein
MPSHETPPTPIPVLRRRPPTEDRCDCCRELHLVLYGRDGERGELGEVTRDVAFMRRVLWSLLVFVGLSAGTVLVMTFSAGRQVEGYLGQISNLMDRIQRIEVLLPVTLNIPVGPASSGGRTGDPP